MDALDYSTRAIPLFEEAVRRDDKNDKAASGHCYAHWGRADALQRLKRYSEALPAWDKAIALNREDHSRPWLVSQRAVCLAHTGAFPKAHAAVKEVLSGKRITSRMCYDGARTIALCAAAERDAERNRQGTKMAMDLLQKAVNAGFKDIDSIQRDTELDPLREREDFKTLLVEVEKRVEKK